MGIKGKVDKMVVLACEECKERNYTTTKNKNTNKERLELNKYCPKCQKKTVHKETKQSSGEVIKWQRINLQLRKQTRRAGSRDLKQSSRRLSGLTEQH